jgi:hypothetical protein
MTFVLLCALFSLNAELHFVDSENEADKLQECRLHITDSEPKCNLKKYSIFPLETCEPRQSSLACSQKRGEISSVEIKTNKGLNDNLAYSPVAFRQDGFLLAFVEGYSPTELEAVAVSTAKSTNEGKKFVRSILDELVKEVG